MSCGFTYNVWSLIVAWVALLVSTCALARASMTVKTAQDLAPRSGDTSQEQESRTLVILYGDENYRTAPKRVPAPDFVPPVVRDIPVNSVRDVPPFQVAVGVLLAFAFGVVLAIIHQSV